MAKNIKDFPWQVTIKVTKRLIATLNSIDHAMKFYRKHLIHKIIGSHLITNEIVNIKYSELFVVQLSTQWTFNNWVIRVAKRWQ